MVTKKQEQHEELSDHKPESVEHFRRYSETTLPTRWGDLKSIVYRNFKGEEHMVICTHLDQVHEKPPLVRIHSACFTSEVFGSTKCDCREQLEHALEMIQSEGCGAVIYLFQEGRGIGLGAKIRAYALQEQGVDTVDANTQLGYHEDARRYDAAIDILRDLNLSSIRLLTNNPLKVNAITDALVSVERVPIQVGLNPTNHSYLQVKKERMGHLFSSEYLSDDE